MKNKKILVFLAVIFVLAVATFFRFYKLDSIPPGLYPDVAINGNDALNSLKTGDFKLFYPDNNGREGLFFWLIALSFSIFGTSVWSIKIVSAILGTLTVLGTYLLTKEIFKKTNLKNEAIAILASFFLAISFWHVNFSRIGFRAILMPFALTFGFYFLFRGFNSRKIYNLLISGFFFAVGFYSYISYRFVIFPLFITLFLWWLVSKKENSQKQFIRNSLYLFGSTFAFALPIGIYFLFHLQDFFGRAAGVSVFSQPNPLFTFLKSFIVHLGMFNFYGDGNWRHNFAGSPELLWPVGIFFLIGLVLFIKKIIYEIKRRNWSLVFGLWSLLSWFVFLILPSALSYEGIPHALRTLGVIPVPYIFAGIGAVWSFEKIKVFYKNEKSLIVFYVLTTIFLSSLVIAEYDKYFVLWANRQETQDAFSTGLVDVGNYLNTLPSNIDKYVVVNMSGALVNGIPMPAQTPIFIERIKYKEPRAKYILPENLDKIDKNKEAILVPLDHNIDPMMEIISKFPNGKLEQYEGVWIYKLNQK